MSRRFMCQGTITAIFLVMSGIPAAAQETRGSILGRISDASGAAVPNSSVSITNEATGVASTTKATESGDYSFVNLDPGKYTITATATGFKKQVVKDIVLFVAQKERVDLKLVLGDVTTSVEVTASAPVVQSEQASVGSVVDTKQITSMPLNGRSNLYGLMALAPGFTQASVNPLIAGGTWGGSVNMTVDGAANTDVGGDRLLPIGPSLESIAEFSVVSNGTSAEYGRGGAQVIIATKAGTNQFHGSLFEFNRNRVTAAKNFFATGLPKPKFNRNEFGGSLGGPIVKNKLFFFGNYEDLERRSSGTSFLAMPTAALKSGNFAGLAAIRDPVTGAPFPNNIIPASRISPIATELMKFATDPNMPGTGAAGLGNNFVANIPDVEFNHRYTGRVDYEVSPKDRFSARYFQVDNGPYQASASSGTDKFGNWSGNGTATKNVVGSYFRILAPNLITESRFSFEHSNLFRTPQNGDYDPSKFIPGLIQPMAGLGGLPTVTITGFRGFSDQPGSGDESKRYELFQNLTWIKDKHTVKAGFEYQWTSAYNYQNTAPFRGSFQFLGRYTGNAFADFLLGDTTQTGRASRNAEGDFRNNRWSGYVQDDWKVNPKLTLNLGVRYDFFGLFSNGKGDWSNFDLNTGKVVVISGTPDPRLFNTLPMELGKDVGLDPSNWVQNDRNNFSPRVGLAYRPFGGTRFVIRSAYGIYYNDVGGYSFLGVPSNPPFIASETFDATPGNTPSLTFANPFPGAGTIAGFPRVASYARNRVNPYQEQWNFTLEGEVIRNTAVRVSYIGNRGVHLDRVIALNEPPPAPGVVQDRRPYPAFGNINYQEQGRNSILNGIQVGVIRRYSNGLALQMEYQYNNALGENTFAAVPMDTRNARLDRGHLDYVRQHMMTANYIYDLPFGKGKRFLTSVRGVADKLISGWQLTGIVSMGTGQPYSVTFTSTVTGWPSSRANIVGDPSVEDPSINRWFNPAAFAVPAPFTYGNSARNMLFGPGFFSWDSGIFKNTTRSERMLLQFRAEFFNLPNHPNFGLPASNISVPATVGRISSAGDPRTIQFGLRLQF